MKTINRLLLLFVTCFIFSGIRTVSAQINMTLDNGVTMTVTSGTIMNGITNITLLNQAAIDNSGYMSMSGDWTNNAGNTGLINSSPGTIAFVGANQNIQGSDVTNFYNLALSGTGVKYLKQDAIIEGEIDLGDRELDTETNTLFVTSDSDTSVVRTTGFVSSDNGGALSRNTASTNLYEFPVGEAGKFRPVELTPNAANANTYTVRFANVNATTEGYDVSVVQSGICSINNQFYHQINQSNGSDAADISIYFDTLDGQFSKIAHWQTVPQWETTGSNTAVINQTPTLSYVTVAGWNDFSYEAFALSGAVTPPTITANGPINICNGGSVTLDAGPGYATYAWANGGGSNQTTVVTTSGTYDVTVSDGGGCTATSTNTITVTAGNISAPNITASGPVDFCPGNSVTLGVDAGFTSYAWSDNTTTTATLTTNASGTYHVTVTDANGCTAVSTDTTVNVFTVTPPTITASGSTTFCDGDSVTLSVSSAYSNIVWTPGGSTDTSIVVKSTGLYSVSANDGNGCSTSSSNTSITVNQAPVVAFTQTVNGLSVTFNNTTSGNPTSYAWDFGDGGTSSNISPAHTYASGGTYTVCLTATNSCGTDQVCNTISTTGIEDVALANAVTVYPNPASGSLYVNYALPGIDEDVTVQMYDVLGRISGPATLLRAGTSGQLSMDISKTPAGVYFVNFQSEKASFVQRVVVTQ